MSFYTTKPKKLETVEVGNSEIGAVVLPRLNGWSPNERDFYITLTKAPEEGQPSEIEDSNTIISETSSKLINTSDWLDSDLTYEDLKAILGELGEHETFREEVEEKSPLIMQDFYERVQKMYMDLEIAKAYTMFKIRLRVVCTKPSAIAEIDKFTFKTFQDPLYINLRLVKRLTDFADAEAANNPELDYSAFSASNEDYVSPVEALTQEVLDILAEPQNTEPQEDPSEDDA